MNNWRFIKEHYIDKGLKIFPVEKNGKTPLIENWQNDCSCDYMQVLYWYVNCKDCNWGMPATPNNIFVLDLDVHDENKNGIESFKKMLNDISKSPFDMDIGDLETLIQITPSGGMHVMFRSDDDLKNVNNGANVFKDYPGIDIRTDGYIVVQPSEINGRSYNIGGHDLIETPIELKQFILNNANTKDKVKNEEYKKPTYVEVGDRDNQLFSYINDLYFKTRLDFDEIFTLAKHFNDTILEKPLPERTIKYKVKKVFEKDRSKYIFLKIYDE